MHERTKLEIDLLALYAIRVRMKDEDIDKKNKLNKKIEEVKSKIELVDKAADVIASVELEERILDLRFALLAAKESLIEAREENFGLKEQVKQLQLTIDSARSSLDEQPRKPKLTEEMREKGMFIRVHL